VLSRACSFLSRLKRTRIWLPLYCCTSTTRGLVCLTKRNIHFLSVSVFFCLEFGKSRVISKGFLLMSWGRVAFSKRTIVLKRSSSS
jgi:hypothetical protein